MPARHAVTQQSLQNALCSVKCLKHAPVIGCPPVRTFSRGFRASSVRRVSRIIDDRCGGIGRVIVRPYESHGHIKPQEAAAD